MSKANNMFQKATQFGSHLRDIVDVPLQVKQYKARTAKKQADSDVAIIKRARSYDKAPGQNNDGSISEAGMARSLAQDVKDRLKKKKY